MAKEQQIKSKNDTTKQETNPSTVENNTNTPTEETTSTTSSINTDSTESSSTITSTIPQKSTTKVSECIVYVNKSGRDITFWSTGNSNFVMRKNAGYTFDNIPEWVRKHPDFVNLRTRGLIISMTESAFQSFWNNLRSGTETRII
ncbi:MAG: hypothetical protein QXE78_01920 [Nitrososphaeria archaeon]